MCELLDKLMSGEDNWKLDQRPLPAMINDIASRKISAHFVEKQLREDAVDYQCPDLQRFLDQSPQYKMIYDGIGPTLLKERFQPNTEKGAGSAARYIHVSPHVAKELQKLSAAFARSLGHTLHGAEGGGEVLEGWTSVPIGELVRVGFVAWVVLFCTFGCPSLVPSNPFPCLILLRHFHYYFWVSPRRRGRVQVQGGAGRRAQPSRRVEVCGVPQVRPYAVRRQLRGQAGRVRRGGLDAGKVHARGGGKAGGLAVMIGRVPWGVPIAYACSCLLICCAGGLPPLFSYSLACCG